MRTRPAGSCDARIGVSLGVFSFVKCCRCEGAWHVKTLRSAFYLAGLAKMPLVRGAGFVLGPTKYGGFAGTFQTPVTGVVPHEPADPVPPSIRQACCLITHYL